jgi:uncharacterized membrane protein YjfL (UPF0719 family)
MDALTTTLEFVVEKLPYFAAGIVLVFLGKLFYNLTTKYDIDRHLTAERNSAVGISFGGYLLGLGFVIAAAARGSGHGLLTDLINLVIVGIIAIFLLRLSGIINDRLVLHSFSTEHEMVQERSVGTGFVVGGMTVATGLMISGVMDGQSANYLSLLRDIAVYWLVGQALLVLDGLVFQAITSYDVHGVIEDDKNVAAGVSFAGFLVAQGVIVRTAVAGAGSDLGTEVLITAVIAICGLILLVVGRVIADRVFLPRAALSDEVRAKRNTAAAAIAAASFIVVALIYSGAADPNVALAPLAEGSAASP